MSDTVASRNELSAAARLRRALKRDPDWVPFVGHWLREGFSEEDVLDELARAKRCAWRRARGYPAGKYP